MKGSPEPEADTDEQCPHCGLFYSRRGIIPHRRNCQYQEWPGTLHPEAVEEPGEPGFGFDRDPPDRRDGGLPDERTPTQPDDVGAKGAPPSQDGGDPERDAATDGGPMTPPTPAVDDGDQEAGAVDADPEPEPACPTCGSEKWFPPGELPDDVLEAAEEDLEAFDRACLPCSTDDDGRLASPVEVYNT